MCRYNAVCYRLRNHYIEHSQYNDDRAKQSNPIERRPGTGIEGQYRFEKQQTHPSQEGSREQEEGEL